MRFHRTVLVSVFSLVHCSHHCDSNVFESSSLACEQALLFGRVKRVSREREARRACSQATSSYASVNSTCAQPPPPPGYCRAFARLVSPGGRAFANFAFFDHSRVLSAKGRYDLELSRF